VNIKRQSKKKSPTHNAKPSSQLEKVNKALRELAKDVISSDREEAPASEPTVIEYLKGNGKNLETGLKLLRFFRKKIQERDKEISGNS
jgi:hypothetical protein